MGVKRYIISDASKLVDVESHVLRYWEDELGIYIPRNEMGHRYYTDYHINLLKNIKEFKDSGYQLRAIKRLLPEIVKISETKTELGDINLDSAKKELFKKIAKIDVEQDEQSVAETVAACGQMAVNVDKAEKKDIECANNSGYVIDNSDFQCVENSESTKLQDINNNEEVSNIQQNKLELFQNILSEAVNNALKENTGYFGKEVSGIVSDKVIKEMDCMMRLRDQQEEERYRKLDETIRNYQNLNKESAKRKNLVDRIKKMRKYC